MDHNRVCPCMCAVCTGPRGHRVGDVKAGRTPCLLSLTFVALPIFGSSIPRDLPSPHSWDIPRNHGPPNSPCSPLTLWKDFSFYSRVLRVKCYKYKTSYIPAMEAEEGGSRNSGHPCLHTEFKAILGQRSQRWEGEEESILNCPLDQELENLFSFYITFRRILFDYIQKVLKIYQQKNKVGKISNTSVHIQNNQFSFWFF